METAIALVGTLVLVVGAAYFYNRWKTSKTPKNLKGPDKPFPG